MTRFSVNIFINESRELHVKRNSKGYRKNLSLKHLKTFQEKLNRTETFEQNSKVKLYGLMKNVPDIEM